MEGFPGFVTVEFRGRLSENTGFGFSGKPQISRGRAVGRRHSAGTRRVPPYGFQEKLVVAVPQESVDMAACVKSRFCVSSKTDVGTAQNRYRRSADRTQATAVQTGRRRAGPAVRGLAWRGPSVCPALKKGDAGSECSCLAPAEGL